MENLEDLKVGDKVCYESGLSGGKICVISRITNTMIMIEGINYVGKTYEIKFNRKTGYVVGDYGYFRPYITTVNEEKIKEVNDKNRKSFLVNKISNYNFNKLGLDELEIIYSIIDK